MTALIRHATHVTLTQATIDKWTKDQGASDAEKILGNIGRGDMVLLTDQIDPSLNGLYRLKPVSTGGRKKRKR